MRFSIYRYNPETDKAPRMQTFVLDDIAPGMMLRDALLAIREQ
ncbi:MAG TPA: succinate dehydrogenase iron-sulfur subunit, partial [Gammaproteobacteria bacterium]